MWCTWSCSMGGFGPTTTTMSWTSCLYCWPQIQENPVLGFLHRLCMLCINWFCISIVYIFRTTIRPAICSILCTPSITLGWHVRLQKLRGSIIVCPLICSLTSKVGILHEPEKTAGGKIVAIKLPCCCCMVWKISCLAACVLRHCRCRPDLRSADVCFGK